MRSYRTYLRDGSLDVCQLLLRCVPVGEFTHINVNEDAKQDLRALNLRCRLVAPSASDHVTEHSPFTSPTTLAVTCKLHTRLPAILSDKGSLETLKSTAYNTGSRVSDSQWTLGKSYGVGVYRVPKCSLVLILEHAFWSDRYNVLMVAHCTLPSCCNLILEFLNSMENGRHIATFCGCARRPRPVISILPSTLLMICSRKVPSLGCFSNCWSPRWHR